jgi:hypothetical protein
MTLKTSHVSTHDYKAKRPSALWGGPTKKIRDHALGGFAAANACTRLCFTL